MKRIAIVVMLTVILAAGVAVLTDVQKASAEKPTATTAQNSYAFTVNVDSTDAYVCDTLTTFTNSSTKLFEFTGVKDYSNFYGWYVLQYTTIDTGIGGVVPDTSKDTVWVRIYTADASGTPYKLIYSNKVTAIHATAGVVNADYVGFNLSDSVLWDKVYGEIIYGLADSTYDQARNAAGIDYKITFKSYAK